MVKKLLNVLLIGGIVGFSGCKSQKIQVSPGAYVATDGTKDGLEEIQKEFGSASKTSDGIKLTLESDVLFPTNSSYLSDKAKLELDKLVKVLKDRQTPYEIEVEGHTDATGTAAYNLDLSEKRANSVKKYLVSNKIASDKVKTKGLGLTKPIAPNNTVEGRAKNRRVEILIRDKK